MVGFSFLVFGLVLLRLVFSGRAASPGLGLAGQARRKLGPAGLAPVALAVVFFFTGIILVVIDFADFFSTVMPATPSFIFRGVLLLFTTLALAGGVEVLGRVALILLPVNILFFLAGILGNLPSFEPARLLPLLERGVEPVARASFQQIAYTGDLITLGFLGTYLGNANLPVRRAAYRGFLIVAGLFFLASLFLIGVMGESYTASSNFKLFNLFRYGLQYTNTGYESLFMVVWVSIFFVKVALFQGAIGAALGEITPVKPSLYFLVTGAAVFAATFFLNPNRIEFLRFYSWTYPPFALALIVLFLGLVLIFPKKDPPPGEE